LNHFLSSSDYIDKALETLPLDSDRQLIQAIAKGDEAAFNELYARYNRLLYSYMLFFLRDRFGAEDVLQDVFVAAWRGAQRFRGHSQVKTWLYRIAYRRAVSWLRKHSAGQMDDDLVQDYGATGPEDSLDRSLEQDRIRKALVELPIKQRAVVELAYGEGMSYSEIAEVMGVPVGTVKSRMSHALRSLSALVQRAEPARDFGET
jgi:RNA polymerase sigma-70 factor (ECF subfamily)